MPGRYTAASFFSSRASPCPPCDIGPFELPNRLFAAPMAGVTDRPFRQLCKRLGAGYAVSEMVTSRKDLWAQPEDLAPRQPRRRGGADRGADRRHRRRDDGRGRGLQHRPRRADHRHQHGLPGQEGVQQVGRLGADAGRAAGAAHRRGGGRRLRAARRAGDAEDAHRLARRAAQRGARSRARPKAPASRWSPCTAARASRATRARPSTTPSPRSRRALRIPVVANGDIDSPRKARRGAGRAPAPTRS